MNNLLVIFIVLLVLIVLISTMGGSIYQKDHFYQEETQEPFWEDTPSPAEAPKAPEPETPKKEEEAKPSTVAPEHFQEEDVVEAFDGDMFAAY